MKVGKAFLGFSALGLTCLLTASLFVPRSVQVSIEEDQLVWVPLPLFSVKTKDSQYVTFLPFPQAYFESILPEYGWKQIDRLGALHVLSNGSVEIAIYQQFRFTRLISEISIESRDLQ